MNNFSDLAYTTDKFILKPDWASDPTADFDLYRDIKQYPGTVKEIILKGDNLARSLKYSYTNISKVDEHYITNFFIEHRGRLNRFWLPEWKNSFILTSQILAGERVVSVTDVRQHTIDLGHERIFIELNDGDILTRKVLSVIDAGATEDLLLQTAIDRDIGLNDIKYFGFFMMVRFDSDILEMKFLTNEKSRCVLSFKELPFEYDPEAGS